MSASCDMTIHFKGSEEDFQAIIKFLKDKENVNENNIFLKSNKYYPFRVDEDKKIIEAYNGSCRNIWGYDFLDPDSDMFVALATIVPNSEFSVESYRVYEVGGGGCETFLNVLYKDHLLTFKSLPHVDTLCALELYSFAQTENINLEDVSLAFAGKTKIVPTQEELQEYFMDYGIDIVSPNKFNKNTSYLVCNNPNAKIKIVQKAKELNIPIISEAKAIRMFGDAFDFQDEREILFADFTYEELCSIFDVDDSITIDYIETMKVDPEYLDFILQDGVLSTEGNWNVEIYNIDTDNKRDGS